MYAGSEFEHHDIAARFDLNEPAIVSICKNLFKGILGYHQQWLRAARPFPSEGRTIKQIESVQQAVYGGSLLQLHVIHHTCQTWPGKAFVSDS